MNRIFLLAPAILLSACVAAPKVTDFNGASVKLNTDPLTAYPNALTASEAARICGMSGKHSEYASTRQLPGGEFEHLYLCL